MKIEGSGSTSQRRGSADPDPEPHQNVMDPQHCSGCFTCGGAAVVKNVQLPDSCRCSVAVVQLLDSFPVRLLINCLTAVLVVLCCPLTL
jgi:hypothetical protein